MYLSFSSCMLWPQHSFIQNLQKPSWILQLKLSSPFAATWMDLEFIILSEVSQTNKDKYHMVSLICEIWKKMMQMNLFTKQKQNHRLLKTNMINKGERGAGINSVQFNSVAQSCPTLCNPMNCSTPGFLVHHQLSEFTQTHAHRVGDAIQPSHPLSSPSPPDPNPSKHQSFFQWVNSSHEGAKVLELQLQHQSFQWTPRTYLL